MATNFINMFKIGQLQSPTGTSSTSKVDYGNSSKPNSIFNAAGMNSLAEDSIGDSFTRTTNKTDEVNNPVENKGKEQSNNAKNIPGATVANGATTPTFGLNSGLNSTNNNGENKFGMLSSIKNEDIDKDNSKTSMGFGSLAVGNATKYTTDNSSELQELADKLGCEAEEDTIKNELQKMDAKELAKLDSDLLDIAEDLDLISRQDIEEKTGVSDSDLKNSEKKDDKKIKFGTMTSGDMV